MAFTYTVNNNEITITGYTGTDTTIVIPDQIDGITVKKIGLESFKNKSSITSITLPQTITHIDSSAFAQCSNLASINIPDSVVSIGSFAFDYCINLLSISMSDNVTSLGREAFRGCSKLHTVRLSNSITFLQDWMFSSCSALENVNIPTSLTEIGWAAFAGCSKLNNIILPQTLTRIQGNSFYGCTSLSSINIPPLVTQIEPSTFYYCISLFNLTFASSSQITSIENGAFLSCSNLTSLILPDSITYIGSSAFSSCSKLNSVVLSNNLQSIGANAFSQTSLQNIQLPNTLTNIGASAFRQTKLTNINIHAGIISIGDEAFGYCENLQNINVDQNNPDYSSINGILYNKNKTTLIVCPGAKTGSISVPNGVTNIKSFGFEKTKIAKVIIPDSVTNLGVSVFASCSNLINVTFLGDKPFIQDENNAFFHSNSNLIIYRPSKNQTWNNFSVIGGRRVRKTFFDLSSNEFRNSTRINKTISNITKVISRKKKLLSLDQPSRQSLIAKIKALSSNQKINKLITLIKDSTIVQAIKDMLIGNSDFIRLDLNNLSSIVADNKNIIKLDGIQFKNFNSWYGYFIEPSTTVWPSSWRGLSNTDKPFVRLEFNDRKIIIFSPYLTGDTGSTYNSFLTTSTYSTLSQENKNTVNKYFSRDKDLWQIFDVENGKFYYNYNYNPDYPITNFPIKGWVKAGIFKTPVEFSWKKIKGINVTGAESLNGEYSISSDVLRNDGMIFTKYINGGYSYLSRTSNTTLYADYVLTNGSGYTLHSSISLDVQGPIYVRIKNNYAGYVAVRKYDPNQSTQYSIFMHLAPNQSVIFVATRPSPTSYNVTWDILDSSLSSQINNNKWIINTWTNGITTSVFEALTNDSTALYPEGLSWIRLSDNSPRSIQTNIILEDIAFITPTTSISGSEASSSSGAGIDASVGLRLIDVNLSDVQNIFRNYIYEIHNLGESYDPEEFTRNKFINYMIANSAGDLRAIDVQNLLVGSDNENILLSFNNTGKELNPWYINRGSIVSSKSIQQNLLSRVYIVPPGDGAIKLGFSSAAIASFGDKLILVKSPANNNYYAELEVGVTAKAGQTRNVSTAKYINANPFSCYEVFYNDKVYLLNGNITSAIKYATDNSYTNLDSSFYDIIVQSNLYKDYFFHSSGRIVALIYNNIDNIYYFLCGASYSDFGSGYNAFPPIPQSFVDKIDLIKDVIYYRPNSTSFGPGQALFVLLTNGDLYTITRDESNNYNYLKIDENILQITLTASSEVGEVPIFGTDIFYNLKQFKFINSAGVYIGTNNKYRILNGRYGIKYFGGPISTYFNGVYYLNEIATTLNQSGTGSWNNKYYIEAVETTLDSEGNGVWNNKYYENGILVTSSGDFTFGYVSGGIRITSWSGTETSLEIPSSILGVPVKRIGNQVFQNKNSLTSVVIPNSVTTIEASAFSGCSSLTSVTIPNSITSIENAIFYNCSSLTSITIPNSLATISNSMFYGCANLTSITIPNSITSIKAGAFFNCTSLTSVVIPNSVTTIESSAFSGCSSLTSVTIPNSLATISYNMFYGCANLTSITIPNSVTSIGDNTFTNAGLASIILPQIFSTELSRIGLTEQNLSIYYIGNDGLVRLNDNLYTGSASDRYIINGVITTLNSSGTGGWNNQLYENGSVVTTYGNYSVAYENGGVTLSAYTGNETQVNIPNQILGLFVNKIGDHTFANKTSLTSVSIPNSVTTIGSSAFANCSGLTSVTIPNSVTTIGSSAFYNCSGLTSVTIPNSLTSIGSSAFANCSGLTSVSIPNSVTSIGSSAFYNCSGLTSVTIPNFVTSIGSSAFYNCSGLTSVTIPNSVTSIGNSAFDGCTGLTSVTIPNSVTSIGENAFRNCGSLTSASIGNSVTTIGNSAFVGCSGLTSVVIPNSVTSIGNYAFASCSGLTNFIVPNSVTALGQGAFYNCTNLISITLGSSVPSLNHELLKNCTSLINVNILITGSGSISSSVFQNCTSLRHLSIPKSFTPSYYSGAFIGTQLLSIILPVAFSPSVVGSNSELNRLNLLYANLTIYYIGEDNLVRLDGNLYTGAAGGKYIIDGAITTLDSSGTGVWNSQLYENGSIITTYGNYNVAYENGGVTLSAYTGNETEVSIPTQVAGIPVKKIGIGTFQNKTSITSVTILNSVETIEHGAFTNSTNLISVTIPNSVTTIGNQAFENCNSLTSITIPNSVTTIGNNAFRDCDSLTAINVNESNQNYASVDGVLFNKNLTQLIAYPKGKTGSSYTIPNSVTTIGNHAFFYSGLTSVTIPNFVTSIGSAAFQGCISLSAINVSESNQNYASVDGVLFNKNLTQLIAYPKGKTGSSYTIPNSVTTIESLAFQNCSGLTSVSIPNSVTTIGSSAFYGCTGLTSVSIPNSVTTIESSAFSGCSSLTSVTIPNSITSIENGAFENCTGLTSVSIPNSVTSIGVGAFYNCNSLTSITIPNSVTTIGGVAFYRCYNLTSVTILNSVTSIGNNAFYSCTGLTDIVLPQIFSTELNRIGINPNINITYT